MKNSQYVVDIYEMYWLVEHCQALSHPGTYGNFCVKLYSNWSKTVIDMHLIFGTIMHIYYTCIHKRTLYGHHLVAMFVKDVCVKFALFVLGFWPCITFEILTPKVLLQHWVRNLAQCFLPACNCMQHTALFCQHDIHTDVTDYFTYKITEHAAGCSVFMLDW